MSASRREFLSAAAAALASTYASAAAPYKVSVFRDAGAKTHAGSDQTSPAGTEANVSIPSTMPMGSGAPLGGIGTGFVEIRADGCFHEWQIFNSGAWSQNARSTTAPPGPGPQYLRFILRTKGTTSPIAQVRRLYLRSDESDNYTFPYVQDIESIDYHAWFPITGLSYNDNTLPVRVSALVFSPFIPGDARASATPGFHVSFTLENTSHETVDASLAGFLDNPLASALADRRLSNTIAQGKDVTSLLFDTQAQTDFPSGIGNMCFSVSGGEHSYLSGTYQNYALPGNCRWETPRNKYMLLNVLDEILRDGKLPNSLAATDPGLALPSEAEIDKLSLAEVAAKIKELSSDPMLGKVFRDARTWNPEGYESEGKSLLREVRTNLLQRLDGERLTWGTGALASSVSLRPGQKANIRFTLSWYFPHHLTVSGREIGHMYANWFKDAGEVNHFLCRNYDQHFAGTQAFARTLTETSLGEAMAFSWSSQLSTAVFNTWWTKDGGYAIWEGLGCCGLSTTDVDYQGSFPIIAMFPELKLGQMRRIIAHQNALGQVPHTYSGDLDQVDGDFARVDMNSQFVMMVCRDYLWTGDKQYLAFMWPYIKKAMSFIESLDTNQDALPDRDTGFQTYDQWRMRGTPSYIASLWIGALRAGVRIAADVQDPDKLGRWTRLLVTASTNFDKLLFNNDYYSLWVDGDLRDELCMTDQISGEWFTHLIGLPTTISRDNLERSASNVLKNNFNPEFGVHNATAPKGGLGLLMMTNLQAGGVWSGIEFAFASFLMDHGRYADGVKIVEAIHRRYLRAGQPWNHTECGGHYSRAMSSWTTLLAATGFKPDVPNKTLAILPSVPGDFRAPWVTEAGFGTITVVGQKITISCVFGSLRFQFLKLPLRNPSARVGSRILKSRSMTREAVTTMEFSRPVVVETNETLILESSEPLG